mgnify:CR=1 FL=1
MEIFIEDNNDMIRKKLIEENKKNILKLNKILLKRRNDNEFLESIIKETQKYVDVLSKTNSDKIINLEKLLEYLNSLEDKDAKKEIKLIKEEIEKLNKITSENEK